MYRYMENSPFAIIFSTKYNSCLAFQMCFVHEFWFKNGKELLVFTELYFLFLTAFDLHIWRVSLLLVWEDLTFMWILFQGSRCKVRTEERPQKKIKFQYLYTSYCVNELLKCVDLFIDGSSKTFISECLVLVSKLYAYYWLT